jgi:hypothetical protein
MLPVFCRDLEAFAACCRDVRVGGNAGASPYSSNGTFAMPNSSSSDSGATILAGCAAGMATISPHCLHLNFLPAASSDLRPHWHRTDSDILALFTVMDSATSQHLCQAGA